MENINFTETISLVHEAWNPNFVEEGIKPEVLQGEYDWQKGEDADELFLVLQGRMLMMFHQRNVWLEQGQYLVVPQGVAYKCFVPEGVCRVVRAEAHKVPISLEPFHDKSIAGLRMLE